MIFFTTEFGIYTVRRNLGDSQTFALKRELLVLRYEDDLIEPGQIK